MEKDRKNIIKELEDLSPNLRKLKEVEPSFSDSDVPAGYFNRLPSQIMNQLELEPNPLSGSAPKTSTSSWWYRLFQARLALGLAAVTMLLVMVFVVIKPFESQEILVNNELDQEANQVSSEELYSYILDNLEDFDSEAILDLAADVPLDFILPNEMSGGDAELEELMDELLEEVDLSNPSDIL